MLIKANIGLSTTEEELKEEGEHCTQKVNIPCNL